MFHVRQETKNGDKSFGVDQRITITNIPSEGNELENIELRISEQLERCGCVPPEAIKAIYTG